MFKKVIAELGMITGLVNNAGIHGPRGRPRELSKKQIRAVIKTNVIGCFLCSQVAIKLMSNKHRGVEEQL